MGGEGHILSLSARSYLDWLSQWFSQNTSADEADAAGSPRCRAIIAGGENTFLRWFVHDDTKLIGPAPETIEEPMESHAENPETWQNLERRLSWKYPFLPATRQPAKVSVSALRRRAAEQMDEESAVVFRGQRAEDRA